MNHVHVFITKNLEYSVYVPQYEDIVDRTATVRVCECGTELDEEDGEVEPLDYPDIA